VVHYLPAAQEAKLIRVLESSPEGTVKITYRKMGWERDLLSILSITEGPEEVCFLFKGGKWKWKRKKRKRKRKREGKKLIVVAKIRGDDRSLSHSRGR
jgi:hypothetical protein